jgi:hypothetical protein
MTEIACGSKEILSPFPVSPKGKPGGVGSPHAGSTMRANKKRLARIAAAGSPHKGAAAPLWIPCERGAHSLNRMFHRRKSAENRPTLGEKTEHYLGTWLQRKIKKSRHGVLT